MKLSEIKKLNIDDYYWRLVYGKSEHKATYLGLRNRSFKNLPPPVFFLSTGRCGTNWFTNLLAKNKSVKVFHEPKPNLAVQGRVAWEFFSKTKFKLNPDQQLLLEEILHTAREQYIRYSYKTQRRYIETNNHATFFAPIIAHIFPNAKFVHLNRHPGEFVRSALRRNFYNNPDDIKRIKPVSGSPDFEHWESFHQIEKNAWLWNETNMFIENFKDTINPSRYFYFDFNKLNVKNVKEMLTFLDISISDSVISNLIQKPSNVQRTGNVAGYKSWKSEHKMKLDNICGELAKKYGYEL
jgi:hypothetical protein